MSPQTQPEAAVETVATATPAPRPLEAVRWSFTKRIAFRFCFLYFGLFCLFTQIFFSFVSFPALELPDPGTLPPIRQAVSWTATHVFGYHNQLIFTGSGSGDKTYDWVLDFCILITAAAGTALWTALDRKRASYTKLYAWFRLAMRFALASQLVVYGMAKVVPLQMPFPYLTRLLEPYGNFSPMGVLWSFIGASPAYETCVGSAELLGGLLLVLPRTTLLGAIIAAFDMTQVFLLNMTYDVPVKLFSFHLLLLSIVLLAPDFRRLVNLLLWNRAVEPSHPTPLFRKNRWNRIALAVQIAAGCWLVGLNIYGGQVSWKQYGGGRSKSELYGIWNVQHATTDGHTPVPPAHQFRRLIFDFPQLLSVQNQDNTFSAYGASVDTKNNRLTLTNRGRTGQSAGNFGFTRTAANRMSFIGQIDGQPLQFDLELVDLSKMQITRGFHWIQEYPYNR